MPRKGFGSTDSETIYTSIYPSVHNKLIRNIFEAHIVRNSIVIGNTSETNTFRGYGWEVNYVCKKNFFLKA